VHGRTVKQRYIGRAQHRHPHQMLRVDRESRELLSESVEETLLQRVLETLPEHAAVLISDYAKGVCTPRVLSTVIDAARRQGIPVIVDPGATAAYEHYRGATAITPNRLETKLATGCEIETKDDAFAAGRTLCERLDLE
jgi:D-beta-D-heptose 7-phosphate kinase/D-beta-D-heptose 1-phosphate adenosyltransferase